MKENDDKLGALLKQWRGIEPRTNFEANIWHTIRTAAQPVERLNWLELIGRLVGQPAWSVAVALVMAVTIGIWAGIASMPRQINPSAAELQFLSAGTLTGGYVQMTSREAR